MTPKRLDVDVAHERLRQLHTTLDQLQAIADGGPDLDDDPVTRAAVERLVQVAVDLAVDVNAHVVVAATGAAPATARQSFLDAAEVGALPPALAERLAPAAGLRNVLVHQYTQIRTDLLAAAIPEVVEGFGAYLREMSAYLLRQA